VVFECLRGFPELHRVVHRVWEVFPHHSEGLFCLKGAPHPAGTGFGLAPLSITT
jgi:hypothetical protein